MITHLYMADGSIIIDEPGEPFRKIEPLARATLQEQHGPAIWNPPARVLRVDEVIRYDLFGLRSR